MFRPIVTFIEHEMGKYNLETLRFCIKEQKSLSLLISGDSVKNGMPCSRMNRASNRQPSGGIPCSIPRKRCWKKKDTTDLCHPVQLHSHRRHTSASSSAWPCSTHKDGEPCLCHRSKYSGFASVRQFAERQFRLTGKAGLPTWLSCFLDSFLCHSGSQFPPSRK